MNQYRVTGGLRVECANPNEPNYQWSYMIVEYGPERFLYWWLSDLRVVPVAKWVKTSVPIRFDRCGRCGGTPVTAREAETVLGWPRSGYEAPDNPVFDALRELVHAAGNS